VIHEDLLIGGLAAAVASCWIATLGAWRMRKPTQSLHYLSLAGTVAIVFLTFAMFLNLGWNSASMKTLLICAILIATNSVGTHATARAIRVRKLGHWEPRSEDGVEFVPREKK
jgi:multisubunit Na+/H+ antiporter MnhG subunit